MFDALQPIIFLAGLFATVYAPFHFLDEYAKPNFRDKARTVIQAGQTRVYIKPLASLLDAVFGPRHLTLRCMAMSCVMSAIFTVLFLGVANSYILNLSDYFDRRQEIERPLVKALDEFSPRLLNLMDTLIPAMERDKSPEGQRALAEMKARRAQTERMMNAEPATAPGILLLDVRLHPHFHELPM